MATCPAGHQSATDDYCDTCGAPINPASGSPSAPAAGAAPGATGDPGGETGGGTEGSGAEGGATAGAEGATGSPAAAGTAETAGAAEASGAAGASGAAAEAGAATTCPGCGDTVVGRFCESCGYDIESGEAPKPASVTLILSADRKHWDRMVGSGEPAFPAAVPTLTLELTGDRATLGRIRSGATSDVDLALTGVAADPGVSHYQCEFERQAEGGAWIVRDSGSSNGTWINDAEEPLEADETHTLAEGDRIFVGAWTCFTVHLASPTPST